MAPPRTTLKEKKFWLSTCVSYRVAPVTSQVFNYLTHKDHVGLDFKSLLQRCILKDVYGLTPSSLKETLS